MEIRMTCWTSICMALDFKTLSINFRNFFQLTLRVMIEEVLLYGILTAKQIWKTQKLKMKSQNYALSFNK